MSKRNLSPDEVAAAAADPAITRRITATATHLKAAIPAAQITGGRIGSHDTAIKNSDGEYEEHRQQAFGLTFKTVSETPKWRVVDRAPPVKIAYRAYRSIKSEIDDFVVMSDWQTGFYRDQFGAVKPMHDRRAFAIVEQVIADIQPRGIGGVGDLTDLAELSRYPQFDIFAAFTQASLNATKYWLTRFEAAAGPRIVRGKEVRLQSKYLGGNHDNRLARYLQQNAKVAMGIRKVGVPDSFPVFSLPYLLGFDELDIEYTGEHPGAEWWVVPNKLLVLHTPPKKTEFLCDVIHGDLHKMTMDSRTAHDANGPRTFYVWDIGCMCSIRQNRNFKQMLRTEVPSAMPRTSWQQGFAVVSVDKKTQSYSVEQVRIEDGAALFRGKRYIGVDDVDLKKEVMYDQQVVRALTS